MDWEIGEIRQINDEWYQCLEDTNNCHCDDCDLDNIVDCYKIVCRSDERIDNKNIYFKKLEKVGEPIVYMNKTFQRLKTLDNYCCKYCYFWNQACNGQLCGEKLFLVEVKKDIKGDKKEYEMHDAKEDIPEFDKVVDECLFGKQELKLKPFDVQKAKEGKPVCTRDGRSVRIVCFDMNSFNNHIIVALITEKNGTESISSYTSEGKWKEIESENDLMMLPEKKSG